MKIFGIIYKTFYLIKMYFVYILQTKGGFYCE